MVDRSCSGLYRAPVQPRNGEQKANLTTTDEATVEGFYERFKCSVIRQIEADRSMLGRQRYSPAGWRRLRERTTSCAWRWRSGERAAATGVRICRRSLQSVGRRWRLSASAVRRSSPSTYGCRCRRCVRTLGHRETGTQPGCHSPRHGCGRNDHITSRRGSHRRPRTVQTTGTTSAVAAKASTISHAVN